MYIQTNGQMIKLGFYFYLFLTYFKIVALEDGSFLQSFFKGNKYTWLECWSKYLISKLPFSKGLPPIIK